MKKISKKDYHDIQLKSIRLVLLNSSVNSNSNQIKDDHLEIITKVGNLGEVLDSTQGKCFLKTKVSGVKEEETEFEVEVVYEGLCKSSKELSEKEFKFFLELQAIPMLWSYTRETINNTMLKMGLNPILLPVLNITEIINNMKKTQEGEHFNE